MKQDRRISEKDLERVLLGCISAANDAGMVCRPTGFFTSFRGLSEENVLSSLHVLDSRGVIEIRAADLPDSKNITFIKPLYKSNEYLVEREEARRSYWKNWRWNIAAALITAVAAAFLGAFLARASQAIWPLQRDTLPQTTQSPIQPQ